MSSQTSAPARVPFFDITRQFRLLEAEMTRRIVEFLPGQQLTGGAEVERFEEDARRYLESAHAMTISNGTDALLVALMALEVGPGDEVIVPAFTFFCTASVVARLGATPVFVDILPDTFNLDPAAVAAAVTGRTKAVIGVHLYGQAFDIARVQEICERHGIAMIEDAAQAFGALWEGQQVGTFGTLGCFSFYPTKNLGALGEGGLISTQDAELDARIRALRVHGSCKRYEHFAMGGNFRLASIQCLALGIKLRYLNGWLEQRRAHAQYYFDRLSNMDGLTLPVSHPHVFHTFNQFVVRSEHRDALRDYMTQAGVGTDVYYPMTVPAQKAFAYLKHQAGEFPVAEKAAREVLALPIFPELMPEERQRVVEVVGDFHQGRLQIS
jgi:dTDP-4-amino-4,6-dideoxygalactose transaminase